MDNAVHYARCVTDAEFHTRLANTGDQDWGHLPPGSADRGDEVVGYGGGQTVLMHRAPHHSLASLHPAVPTRATSDGIAVIVTLPARRVGDGARVLGLERRP